MIGPEEASIKRSQAKGLIGRAYHNRIVRGNKRQVNDNFGRAKYPDTL